MARVGSFKDASRYGGDVLGKLGAQTAATSYSKAYAFRTESSSHAAEPTTDPSGSKASSRVLGGGADGHLGERWTSTLEQAPHAEQSPLSMTKAVAVSQAIVGPGWQDAAAQPQVRVHREHQVRGH